MQFLQNKLADIGKVNFVEYMHNNANNSDFSNTWSYEVSNVSADSGACLVHYHWRVTQNGKQDQDKDAGFLLSDVTDVVVKPMEQYQTELDARLGNPNMITTSVSPAVSALLVRRTHNVSNLLPFTEAAMADRVAKAITHAVELCGGGNKEPF